MIFASSSSRCATTLRWTPSRPRVAKDWRPPTRTAAPPQNAQQAPLLEKVIVWSLLGAASLAVWGGVIWLACAAVDLLSST